LPVVADGSQITDGQQPTVQELCAGCPQIITRQFQITTRRLKIIPGHWQMVDDLVQITNVRL